MTYDRIKKNFDRGFWSVGMVKMAVAKGVITEAQYEAIIAGAEFQSDEIDTLLTELESEVGIND